MKKLNKLQISQERLIKGKDLEMLRGGYDCVCVCYSWEGELLGVIGGIEAQYCFPKCNEHFGHSYGDWQC